MVVKSSEMQDVVIVSAVRTPIGRIGGALAAVRPDDLAALVVGEAVRRAGIDPGDIEEVYLGCANQAGEDNRDVARMALLLAGIPNHVGKVARSSRHSAPAPLGCSRKSTRD